MDRRLLSCALAVSLSLSSAWAGLAPAYADDAATVPSDHLFLPLVTLEASPLAFANEPDFPSLSEFTAAVADGNAGIARGVYVPGLLALPIVQQPETNPAYVSSQAGVVTQFRMAAWYGVVGLLAHNYLAGQLFFDLEEGDAVSLVYGDGAVTDYQVSRILSYQALQPYSTSSEFVDLETGETLSAVDVFMLVYSGGDQVTFQTCIASGSLGSWGRLFVIAQPVD